MILYSGVFGLFFVAIGLLAHLATDFESHQAASIAVADARANGRRSGAEVVLADFTSPERIVEITAHRERLATVGEVTARVVHELSNPLTGITTLIDDLLESSTDGQRESLKLVGKQAERAVTMVRELLHFARRGNASDAAPVNDIVERAISFFTLSDRYSGVEIVRALSSEALLVPGGPSLLEQVVLNLLENARHALEGRDGARITIRTQSDGERVILEISDNGHGVPPELQGRIFEPFFTTKEAGVGTGLGLAIVEGIVSEVGGAISVRSRPGRGTTFRLEFPNLAYAG